MFSILQGNRNPFCERGTSLKRNLVIARRLSIQSYLFFLGKSHFGNIYIYNKLIAYVTRKNNPPDFNHIESTLFRMKMLENHHSLANQWKNSTISQEVRRMRPVSNLFGDVLSSSFNVIAWSFYEKMLPSFVLN